MEKISPSYSSSAMYELVANYLTVHLKIMVLISRTSALIGVRVLKIKSD